MTTTPQVVGGFTPIGNPLPLFIVRPLAANEQAGKGQFVGVSPSTGHAALQDAAVPNQYVAGLADQSELSDKNATAGNASVRIREGWFYGLSMGTSTDGFTDSDFCVPFYVKDENTLGKLSNSGGSNRSLGGLVFGLGPDGTPYGYSGIVAHLLARACLVVDNNGALWQKAAADGAAATATAESIIPRLATHGVVTAVTITPAAALTADATNNATITIRKRDGAGGAAVTVATLITDVAGGSWTAFVPKAFALSGTAANLNLLETDVLTLEITKGGTGVVVPISAVRVAQKVI